MRELRKALALLVCTIAIAGAGIAIGPTGDASAELNVDTTVQQATVTGESPTGEIDGVDVTLNGTIEWSGFQNDVDEVSFGFEPVGDDFEGVDTEIVSLSNAGTEGSLEISDLDTTPGIYVRTPGIDAPDDGETITRTIPINVSIAISNSAGEIAHYDETKEVTVKITNLADDGSDGPSMDADLDLEAEVDMADD